MKTILCFVGLFIGTLAVMQSSGSNMRHCPPCSPCSQPSPPVTYRYYCDGHRNQSCKRNSAPTCGWYNQDLVHCNTFPCAAEFSNPCVACNNGYVKYVTCGKCPPSNFPVADMNYKDAGTNQLPTCN